MPPIVNFFNKDETEGTDLYTAGLVFGHSFFLMFNVLNAAYIILIQWFALGKLSKNTILMITLAGCLLQQGSCISSITRWNTGDPHGATYGIPSAVFGILANSTCNMVYVHLWFQKEQQQFVKAWCATFAAIGIILSVLTYTGWDNSPASFKYLLALGPLCTLWHLVSVWHFRSNHKKGEIKIEGTAEDSDSINKVLLVCILLEVFALVLEMTAAPAFKNGAPGIHYVATVIVALWCSDWNRAGYSVLN